LLIQWYLQNKSDLPWQQIHTNLALRNHVQQTRVAQGTPYFFLSQILLFFDLAEANEEEQC
jgi:adenine-specific DNA glycosylase